LSSSTRSTQLTFGYSAGVCLKQICKTWIPSTGSTLRLPRLRSGQACSVQAGSPQGTQDGCAHRRRVRLWLTVGCCGIRKQQQMASFFLGRESTSFVLKYKCRFYRMPTVWIQLLKVLLKLQV